MLQSALAAAPLFTGLDQEWQLALFNTMQSVNVKGGEFVIRQGEPGDSFFVVRSGSLQVRVVPEGAEGSDADGGRVVHQYQAGGRFGELALLYDKPRAASVVAVADSTLWRLERWAFDEITKKSTEVQARMLL
jgi:cAMP-dependent protein kinase regulator